MGCDYCVATDLPKVTMTAEVGRKAIDLFVDLAAGGKSIEFVFTGGEPFMASGLLGDMTRYARYCTLDAGMLPSFVVKTNGTLLTSRAIEYLKLNEAKVVVSIDGMSSTHDKHRLNQKQGCTHAKVVGNLYKVLQNEINCSVSVTVHPDASSQVLENVRYLHGLGIEQLSVGPAYGTVRWSVDQIAGLSASLLDVARFMRDVRQTAGSLEVGPLYKESEHVAGKLSGIWGCNAASTNLAFLPDGRIAGCSALGMLTTKFPELVLGDVFEGLNQEVTDRMVRLAQADAADRPKCQSCETAENCAGGCLAFDYATSASPFTPPRVYCNTIATIPVACDLAWGTSKD